MSQRCHTGLVRRNNGAAMSCISPVAVMPRDIQSRRRHRLSPQIPLQACSR